jgi:hypothetical protein
MQNDPNFRDFILFHEYFDGDTGRGCGASHQTGWTGLVALLLDPRPIAELDCCLPMLPTSPGAASHAGPAPQR